MTQTTIIDGKKLADDLIISLKDTVSNLHKHHQIKPGLAVCIIGNDPASHIYVKKKHQIAEQIGIQSNIYHLPEDCSQNDITNLIKKLNADNTIHGILLQLPLPAHLSSSIIIDMIDPNKDVDGLTTINQGRLITGNPLHMPCTPAGIIHTLKQYNIPISSKKAVIMGRSRLVGLPIGLLLLQANATVSYIHSQTSIEDKNNLLSHADIVIAAIGKPKYLNPRDLKSEATIIDVGINRLADGSLCGDVDYQRAIGHARYITPVPGGIGPLTVASLMQNTVNACLQICKVS